MQEKIKLYEEMLALEPGSRLFFPLAKMLTAQGEYGRARDVIMQGLSAHPEYMEARLLLLEVLDALGEQDAALEKTETIVHLLGEYQGFWRLWEALLQAQGERDLLVAMRFFRRAMQGTPLRWVDVFEQGCARMLDVAARADESERKQDRRPESVRGHGAQNDQPVSFRELPDAVASAFEADSSTPAESTAGAAELSGHPFTDKNATQSGAPEDMDEPDSDLDADEVETISIDPDVRTRTMADLLMEQEEYGQALEIFEGLREIYPPGPERQDLERRMDAARQKLSDHGETPGIREGEASRDGDAEKDEVVKTLSALAERLEARAGS
jgi:tetratricopeptide (TPR) repeat protein